MRLAAIQSNTCIPMFRANLAEGCRELARAATPANALLQRLRDLRLWPIRWRSAVWAARTQPSGDDLPSSDDRQHESEAAQSGEDAAEPPPRKGAERDWPIETRGVMITGENPMIVLYQPDTDEMVAISSVWTCTYSEAGQGRALVIWADPEATGLGTLAPVGIFTDNPELARFIWANFYNDYAPIHGRGIEEAPIRTARFTEHSGGRSLHRISCTSGNTTIELEWRDVVEVFHAVTYPTGFKVSVVAAPCADAAIIVNGQRAVGEIHWPEGWFKSSAMLAFAETWIAMEEGSGGSHEV